jgi:hypothetical protein
MSIGGIPVFWQVAAQMESDLNCRIDILAMRMPLPCRATGQIPSNRAGSVSEGMMAIEFSDVSGPKGDAA